MTWSKLKSLTEGHFSPSLAGRISLYSTRYGDCSCGRAWLTLDKETVANFCTMAFYNRASGRIYRRNDRWLTDAAVPDAPSSRKTIYENLPYGELSRQNAYRSCWEFVHDLTIEQALASEDPLIQTLAVLDKRLGKRRLRALDTSKLNPLAGKLYRIRLECEGIRRP